MNLGQLSHKATYAHLFRLVILMLLPFASKAEHLDYPSPLRTNMYTWSASAQLPSAATGVIPEVQLLVPAEDFSCDATIHPSGSTLEVHVLGNQEPAPGTDIALVSVGAPGSDGYVKYRVTYDGGGIILVLDEF